GFRVEAPGDLLRVAVAEGFFLGVAERRPVAARHRGHDFAVDHGANVPAALAEPARRAGFELGAAVTLPEVDRLHAVHFGYHHLEVLLAHGCIPPSDVDGG